VLDAATKRRIDSARSILVGKVPDPKTQVEQITTALIYKFMNDMDLESIGLGGKPRFFTGDFEKFSWNLVMSPKLGSQERLNLYGEAISTLSSNSNLPQLFQDIFRGAFLPYRDPETLSLFLKEIDAFIYDHSEDLGDAFEYLLNVLGSQGDAGQFRTPRHIIDFLVRVVAPKTGEKISDPACGTAGFLISAYKFIAASKGSSGLSMEERTDLMTNLIGFDISPDMARLSRVNMYLHNFPEPQIFEYDSLTNDERWGDSFDVLLANPPFMTPKGGIRPHNRFSIKAKKSEILFVDYIMDHLKLNGKAGVIVPDGIIANSPNAYKKLRTKMIRDDHLWAVVSMPAGVFQPYSEVKTSILFFDRSLSKNTQNILFVEVKADGYELGATRKKISKDDIPIAELDLINYKKNLLDPTSEMVLSNLSHLVSKESILKSPAVSLSGKRYKDDIHIKNKNEVVLLGALIEENKIKVRQDRKTVWSVSNQYGFVPSADFFNKKVASDDIKNYKKVSPYSFAYNPARINVGSIALNEASETGCVSPMYVIFNIIDSKKLLPKYLLLLLKSKFGIKQIIKYSDGAVRKTLSFENLKLIKVPLIPIEEQKEILDHFDKINNFKNLIDDENKLIGSKVSDTWGVPDDLIELDEIIDSLEIDDEEEEVDS
jgi:type I restriction enzyme M protein